MGQPSRSDAADDSHVCGRVHHRGGVQGLRSLVNNEHHQGPGRVLGLTINYIFVNLQISVGLSTTVYVCISFIQ